MARADWYRLDNVGKFYASQAGRGGQTVFRFSATMNDAIDPKALQAALIRLVERFPGFNVKLRNGIFWHYLEPSGEIPAVQPEAVPVCTGLHTGLDSVLFRVNYFRDRINLEVSHMISDGRGTLEFFRALLAAYVERRYGVPANLPEDPVPLSRRTEDSYTANFEREKAGSSETPKVYHLSGWKNTAEPTFMEYHLPAGEVHQRAKAMGVSVTMLMIAAVIVAIRNTMPPSKRDRAIRMDVPVDLRDMFESETLRNFFGLAFVSYTPGKVDESLETIAHKVQEQLTGGTDPEALKRRMNSMLKIEKNPLIRAAPLFLKDGGLMIGNWMAAQEVTTTVSSIGRIRLDDTTEPFVREINISTSTRGLNFLFCTFKDVLSMSISSAYITHDVVRAFVGVFTELGVHGTMSVNKSAEQVDEDLRQARFEHASKQIAAARRKGSSR
ncbi:phthiocerol/phthiodiolone dimycocerosyl transferase family protein [Anaerotardibacter muris]|uniref:phthiocerol/phthiodiolone dimycocerosyl transferase family protein n=1 Tax=Anaerotardibacter muris TaxID=2941505 RepID=UPI00203B5379|nr:alcohol acetyltransferase [Anaerotardibacter muris]